MPPIVRLGLGLGYRTINLSNKDKACGIINNFFFIHYKKEREQQSMIINEYLQETKVYVMEGNVQEIQEQMNEIISLIQHKPNIQVMEIGFNAGHSADMFLYHNETLQLWSFDLGEHDCCKKAKTYIDNMYPSRHTLILGDSKTTIPLFVKQHPEKQFDLIFIDGGHLYETVKADLTNSYQHLAHKETIIMMDDTMYSHGIKDGWPWQQVWNQGPTQIWNEFVTQHKIIEMYRKDYTAGRGMCWGKKCIQ